MDESHPLGARTMYGATQDRRRVSTCARSTTRTDSPYVTLRYMNVYGPRQEGGLVMAVTQPAARGRGADDQPATAAQSFDFVHVADVADANVHAMASDVSGDEFNVGSGTEASVREIVEKLIELTGADVEPRVRHRRSAC